MPNNRVGQLIDDEISRLNAVEPPLDEECKITWARKPADNKPRRYFGGSQLGGNCRRQRWYGFHWAAFETFEPRILRLFNRGHREEERFVSLLKMVGIEVQEYDPDSIPILWHEPQTDQYCVRMPGELQPPLYVDVSGTYHEWIACSRGLEIPEPRQFSFSDMMGHHKGNCDGRARYIPGQDQWGVKLDDWVLLEFKTHNAKSFNALASSDVYHAKRDHWVQMQRYMQKIGFTLGLYGAVNKDTDHLYFEFVPFEPEWALAAEEIGYEAVFSDKIPPRLSNSASFWECKWCSFRPQCHYGVPMHHNCRTCVSSFPATNGDWACHRWQKKIPRDAEMVGCDFHQPRTD